MANIKPFKALRPQAQLAKQVASRPYDVLSSAEAKVEVQGNPFSFLHITKSEIDLPESVDVHAQEVYQQAKENLVASIQRDTLFRESKECYYIYQLIMNGRSQTGLVCVSSVDDYENDIKLRYAHLAPYFYVFSYNKITTPGKWKNLIIGDMFMHIQKNIKFEFKNKWDFFVNDFLNHYSEKNNESMKKEEYEFYSENFAKIFAANNFANDFIRETVNKIKYSLSADAIIKNSAIIDWGDNLSKAVRFYPFNTMDNVVFIFRNDGKFSIAVYYYKEYLNHFNDLSLVVGKSDYRNWPEVSNSIVCFARLDNKEFIVIEDAISECAYQIDEMQKYYSNPN